MTTPNTSAHTAPSVKTIPFKSLKRGKQFAFFKSSVFFGVLCTKTGLRSYKNPHGKSEYINPRELVYEA